MNKRYIQNTLIILIILSTAFYWFNNHSEITVLNSEKMSIHPENMSDESEVRLFRQMEEFQFNRLKNPKTNKIPQNIRAKELEFAKRLPVSKKLFKGNRNKSVTTTMWTHEGPNNQGGRTKNIVADIMNNNILLAAAAEGGVWRSTDAGTTWNIVSPKMSVHNVTSIVQDKRTGKTNNWYYATGEYGSNLFIDGNGLGRFLGNGLWKSTDNGMTWNFLGDTQSDSPGHYFEPFQINWGLELDKSNTAEDEIWVAAYSGVFGSTDGGDTWPMSIKGKGDIGEVPIYTSVSVTSTGGVYAALSSGNNSGIYFSANGISWTTITPSFWPAQVNRIVIDNAQSNENILYVIANTPGVGTAGADDGGSDDYTSLWKYNAKYNQWTNLSDKLPDFVAPVKGYSSQGGYDMFIKVKPDNENYVFIGGTNLYRTTNGFATKLNDADWIGGYATSNDISLYPNQHPDQHGLFFLPSKPNIAYSVHDGGISVTNDISASTVVWSNLNTGYLTTQFWSIAIDHATANSKYILGGMQDNGTMIDTLSGQLSNWATVGSGDGTYAAISNGAEYFYISSQLGNIWRTSQNSGWAKVTPADASDFLFITPYLLDPNNTNVMYLLAGDKVWRNSDLTQIPPYDNNSTTVNWSSLIGTVEGIRATALAMSKAAPNLLYVGDNSGNLYKITDASDMNSPFVKISDSTFPGGYISSIAVNPDDGNNVLVGFSNYGILSLFATKDGGLTWSSVGGNLEETLTGAGNGPSVRNVKILPYNGSTVYLVGLSVGLASTEELNGMNTVWKRLAADEIGNVVVETMDVRPLDGTVVVGTFGKGVFSSKTVVTSIKDEIISPNDFSLKQNYPNPFNPSTVIEYSIPQTTNVKLEVFNSLGQKVADLVNEKVTAGVHSVNFDASGLSSGVYFYKFTTKDFTAAKKMIVLR